MLDKYLLIEGKVVKVENIDDWLKQVSNAMRPVKQTHVKESLISTAFLGLDHRFTMTPSEPPLPPILFESMVFGGPLHEYQERYCTIEEALEKHDKLVKRVIREYKWHRKILAKLKKMYKILKWG